MKYACLLFIGLFVADGSMAQQTGSVSGRVVQESGAVSFAVVAAKEQGKGTTTDSAGNFIITGLMPGAAVLTATQIGFHMQRVNVEIQPGKNTVVKILLQPDGRQQKEVVIEGERNDAFVIPSSAPKVEVITWKQVQAFASSNVMDAIGRMNGLREQMNCGVCNTSDIHINGMEGPYTLVLIDGRPIMGGLASVYGMNGIAASVIDRIEVTKGPVAARFGAEAMGGVINIVTKNPAQSGKYSLASFYESNGGHNADAHLVIPVRKSSLLFSGNYYGNQQFNDAGGDNFSDVVMTKRASLFAKTTVPLKNDAMVLTAKAYYEDRFGGQRGYSPALRGSDSIYGESIITQRSEFMGTIPLKMNPGSARIEFSGSWHKQDSRYGTTAYIAEEGIGNLNAIWTQTFTRHSIEAGAGSRGILYDDNTPATVKQEAFLQPGIYVQDEIAAAEKWTLQPGMRLDYHPVHGFIFSPRLHSRWNAGKFTTLRLGAGKGFRVVRLFTEEHAALSGSRNVIIGEHLKPERSLNFTANLLHEIYAGKNRFTIDADIFYTHFSNRILPDYESDQNSIIYRNLDGFAFTRGGAFSLAFAGAFPLKFRAGVTYSDVFTVTAAERARPLFTPRLTGTGLISWKPKKLKASLDYNCSLTGKMDLPYYDEPFTRETKSSLFCMHNIEGSFKIGHKLEVFAGVKNITDYFQRDPIVDSAHPFSDYFDTASAWGPLQGRRYFGGFRWNP